MKTVWEDLNGRLDEVERNWIRIPAAIIISPLALGGFFLSGVIESFIFWWGFMDTCIRGKKL